MNEVIKVKLVDLAAVELREAVTYPFEQCAKLFAVIRRNQLTRRTARCLLVRTPPVAAGLGHILKLLPGFDQAGEGADDRHPSHLSRRITATR